MKEQSRVRRQNFTLLLLTAIIIGATCMFVASCFMIHDAYYVDRQVYETQNAFSANATGTDYISRAFRNVAFISAQLPVNPAEKTMAENITDQTNQVLYNLAKTVTSTGGFMRNVLKINFFLLDIAQEVTVSNICTSYFPEESRPAVTFVGVQTLPLIDGKQTLLSVEAFVALS